MKCLNCPAKSGDPRCKAGVYPRMLVCGHYGCSFNMASVNKQMKALKKTNYDKVRSMSVLELAELLVSKYEAGKAYSTGDRMPRNEFKYYVNRTVEWLNTEVDQT